MTTHTLTQHNDTLTCAACAWRAVFTNDQRIIQTEPGDPGHDHIGQAQALRAQADAYTEQVMDRLRRNYAERRLLPRSDGLHVAPCEELKTGHCVCVAEETMSLQLLQRLYRKVISEGYGL